MAQYGFCGGAAKPANTFYLFWQWAQPEGCGILSARLPQGGQGGHCWCRGAQGKRPQAGTRAWCSGHGPKYWCCGIEGRLGLGREQQEGKGRVIWVQRQGSQTLRGE